MFTGIIETVGAISRITDRDQGRVIRISPRKTFAGVKPGDSIAVDGVCLTVTEASGNEFQVYAVAETLARSTLKTAHTGTLVNIERGLKAGDRLDGHFVTGHVDCVGEIVSEKKAGASLERWIKVDGRFMQQVAEKGSVALDGISLTVAYRESWGFGVALIPYTLAETTAQAKRAGALVNVETDILAKYVETLLQKKENNITLESLSSLGF